KGGGGDLTRQAGTKSRNGAAILREPQRQSAIVVERSRDQVGKAGGCEDTRRYARGECQAGQRYQRNTGPQGVDCGRVRAVRKTVERQVRKRKAAEMLACRPMLGEQDAIGLDPARVRFAAQCLDG